MPVDSGLRLEPELQPAAVNVEPRPRGPNQLGDPRAGEAERREERPAPVALMRRQTALPLAGGVEQVDDHVGFKERPARPRNLKTAPLATGRVPFQQQPVLHRVVEKLREQIEHHVHAPRRQTRGFQLAAERVDAMHVELRRRVAGEEPEHVVQPPLVVQARVGRELRFAALPPSRRGHVDGLVGVER